MRYGPIEASFDVYDDFFSYKSGKSGWIWITYNFIIYSYQVFYINIRYRSLLSTKTNGENILKIGTS